MRVFLLFLALLITSCSSRQPLGLKDHSFGSKAKHIIWFQIPHLSQEHLAFLKMDRTSAESVISFENTSCVGLTWSYNMLSLRPNVSSGFNSQILGSKNTVGKCEDYDRPSVWSYFEKVGYVNALYETKDEKRGELYKTSSCEEIQNPFSQSFVWVQDKARDEKSSTFHFQDNFQQTKPGIYYDKACGGKSCFSSLNGNVKSLWKSLSKRFPKTFFTIRDNVYGNLLKTKNSKKIYERLKEIESLISFFQSNPNATNPLIVISSSAPIGTEFPKEGREWKKFKKSKSLVTYKKSQLVGNVWASGPGAENFCGMYEQSQVLKRFIWAPDRNILESIF